MEGTGGPRLAEAERESLLGAVHGVSGPGSHAGTPEWGVVVVTGLVLVAVRGGGRGDTGVSPQW